MLVGVKEGGPTQPPFPLVARPWLIGSQPWLFPGALKEAAIYCSLIAPLTRLAHKAIHTAQWGFSQQLTRNNIIKPLTKALLFTRNQPLFKRPVRNFTHFTTAQCIFKQQSKQPGCTFQLGLQPQLTIPDGFPLPSAPPPPPLDTQINQSASLEHF